MMSPKKKYAFATLEALLVGKDLKHVVLLPNTLLKVWKQHNKLQAHQDKSIIKLESAITCTARSKQSTIPSVAGVFN